MLLLLVLIASCSAKTSRLDNASSQTLSTACEKGMEKCDVVLAPCTKQKGKDAAKCLCNSSSKLMQCVSTVSGCTSKEKNEIVEKLKITTKMICMAATSPTNTPRQGPKDVGPKDHDDIYKSLPKFDKGNKKQPKHLAEEDDDMDPFEDLDALDDDLNDFDRLVMSNTTMSPGKSDSKKPEAKEEKKEDEKSSSLGDLSKSLFYMAFFLMVAI